MTKEQKKVLKQYPNARLTFDDNGNYIVVSGDTFLVEDYFMPEANDAETAWKYAAVACRVTQNFNRTHPDRMDMSVIEDKVMRINKRLKR
jgi:hypothetical protein